MSAFFLKLFPHTKMIIIHKKGISQSYICLPSLSSLNRASDDYSSKII